MTATTTIYLSTPTTCSSDPLFLPPLWVAPWHLCHRAESLPRLNWAWQPSHLWTTEDRLFPRYDVPSILPIEIDSISRLLVQYSLLSLLVCSPISRLDLLLPLQLWPLPLDLSVLLNQLAPPLKCGSQFLCHLLTPYMILISTRKSADPNISRIVLQLVY